MKVIRAIRDLRVTSKREYMLSEELMILSLTDAKVGDVVYALNATDSDATSPSFLKFSVLEQLKIVNSLGEYMEIPLNISTDQV